MRKAHLSVTILLSLLLAFSCNSTNESGKSENTKNVLPQQATSNVADVTYNTDQIMQAALNGKLNTVEVALQNGFDVNTIDENKRTMLMLSAFNGHRQIVKFLIDKGADLNMRDAINRTALMYASTGPFVSTVEILLKSGAEPNITDDEQNWTAAMMAAAEGQLEVLKVLVNNGADLEMVDVDGESSLDFAKANGHTEVVKYIESHYK